VAGDGAGSVNSRAEANKGRDDVAAPRPNSEVVHAEAVGSASAPGSASLWHVIVEN